MDQQISNFENKKKEIKRYVQHLDDSCKSHFGPHNNYVAPVSNPYTFTDVDAYKKEVVANNDDYWRDNIKDFEKKHVKKHCKFSHKASRRLDPNSRYFSEAKSESQCKGLNGFWDENATNRRSIFDTGTCWFSEKDKECGGQTDPAFLRPYNLKFKDMSERRIEQSNKCHQVPGCSWKQQTGYTWDCVKGERVEELGPAKNPPKDMPIKDGLEEYIFRWYNSETTPLTTELIGEGNRCSGVILEEETSPPEKLRVKEYIDYRLLNPENDRDSAYLKTVMKSRQYDMYIRDWNELQRLGAEKFNAQYKGMSSIDTFYNKMDYDQMMGDMPLEVSKKQKLKGMFPSIPQSVVNMVMKHVAQNNGEKRGMLAWHSTGSGKTCTATGVIDSFWDTDRPIIFASSIDAIASNPDYKFHECAMNLYPRFQQGDFKGKSKAESMALIASAFKHRNVRFLSFAKLSNRVLHAEQYKKEHKLRKISGGAGAKPGVKKIVKKLEQKVEKKLERKLDKTLDKQSDKKLDKKLDKKAEKKAIEDKTKIAVKKVIEKKVAERIRKVPVGKSHEQILASEQYVDLDNAVLIIDEVHNLFRPLPNQKKEHERLEKEILDPKKHPNMKVVILTATPGDNIADVLKLVNIIRNPSEPPIKLENIEDPESVQSFKNQIRGMISYFDMSNDTTKFPIVHDKQEFIKAPMSEIQFNKYLEAYKAIKGDQKNYDALAKQNKLNKYWEGARKYANMLFNFDKDMSLTNFSAKMPHLLDNIQRYPLEKQYVYSSFYTKMGYGGHGIVAVAKELEKKGYKKLDVKEAKKLNAAGKLPTPGKRYILAITTEIGEEGGNAGKNLHELIKIYNSPQNKNGELIHVMLASQGFNEGIDLKAVRHIHFFEPLVTMASDKQTLGRAARYCSHADLDRGKGEWTVEIHRYMSDKPDMSMVVDNTELITKVQHDIASIQYRINSDDTSGQKKEMQDKIKEIKAVIKQKTKAKQSTKTEENEIAGIEKDILLLAKTKDVTKTLKEELKEKEKQLKKLTALPKKNKLDPSSVENIEELVFKESRERMKELLVVYTCMKEAAVDCKVLSEFHSSTGHKVSCAF